MKRKNENMTKNQYFYIDCIIILFGCCLMSTSDPNYENRKPAPSKLKINFFLLSIIGHTIFHISLLIIYFLVIIDVNEDDYNLIEERENDSIYSQVITPINSYVFFLNSVQCLSLVFILNFFSVYKENLFKNRLFNLYLIIVLLILSELISVENYKLGIFNYNLVEFINMKVRGMSSQTSRLILFLFCCISFVGTFLWEFILNFINSNKCQNCCNKKEKEKSISHNDSFPIRKLKTSFGKRRSKTLNLRTSNMSALTSKTINKK
jgi:magnesium-transporting ATPase (P-type)